jgi:hypothetical protein
MQGDVSVELLEEGDPFTDQDWENRIEDLVSQTESKAFARNRAAPDEPDGTEPGPKALVHERREVARVELDGLPCLRQLTGGENEGRRIAVRPAEPLGFEAERGLVSPRPHDVAVDRLQKRIDLSRVHRLAAREVVRGLEPVDAPVLAGDEAIEARGHVDRDARVAV